MPIFEYKCHKCGTVSEFLEKAMNAKEIHTCPSCGGKKLMKQFSTFSAQVKLPAAQSKCHGCPSGATCPHSGI